MDGKSQAIIGLKEKALQYFCRDATKRTCSGIPWTSFPDTSP